MYSVSNFSVYDAAHFFNKIAAGSFIVASLVFLVALVGDCEAIANAVGWTGAITLPLLSLPFFFYARAVLMAKKFIVASFAVMWLVTLGSSLASAFSVHGTRVGETGICVLSVGKGYPAGIVVVAVNNTVIFCMVTFHLLMYSHLATWSEWAKGFIFNSITGHVSKLLMRSGRLYIIPIVMFNITAAVVNLIASISAPYKIAIVVMNVAVQSSLMSRVHRRIKMALIAVQPSTHGPVPSYPTESYDGRTTTATSLEHWPMVPPSAFFLMPNSSSYQQDDIETGGGVGCCP